MPRLSSEHAADQLGYDRGQLNPGILHIGVGAFHRGHQAVFTDDVIARGDLNWGIIGASLRTTTAENQLNPQQGLYTVASVAGKDISYRLVGAITQVLPLANQTNLINTIAHPDIHVVTLTVTEKGYNARHGRLDTEQPSVQRDLNKPSQSKLESLPGILVAGLIKRYAEGGAPISFLSCDNLAHNGQVLKQVIQDYAERVAPALLDWLEEKVSFPCSMVDRIVPATQETDLAALSAARGYEDQALVVAEPFRQWVIEDQFAGPRPAWEKVGALLVADVKPYENAKLKFLNGPHSAAAYLGLLSGYEYIHQVMADEEIAAFLTQLVQEEIRPEVKAPDQLDVDQYIDQVFKRFANAGIAYRTGQVASDGSQKLPVRLLDIFSQRLDKKLPVAKLSIVIAAWIEHLEDCAPDPLQQALQSIYLENKKEPEQLVATLVDDTPIFEALSTHRAAIVSEVSQALTKIRAQAMADASSAN